MVTILVAAMLLTLFNGVQKYEHQKNEAHIETLNGSQGTGVHVGWSTQNQVCAIVQALASFLSSQKQYSCEEFQAFCEPLVRQHDEIAALEWVPYVKHADRELHEQLGRQIVDPNYSIRSRLPDQSLPVIDNREDYFPVFGVSPTVGNERALGLDLAFESSRNEALRFAIRENKLGLSGPIQLVQDDSDRAAFLAFLPVWGDGRDLAAQRQFPFQKDLSEINAGRQLRGMAVGVFRVDEVVRPFFEKLLGELSVTILDVTNDPELLLELGDTGGVSRIHGESSEFAPEPITTDQFGRSWQFNFAAIQKSPQPIDESIWSALAIGMLLSFLFAGLPVIISFFRQR